VGTRATGEWRVGDVVCVAPGCKVTHLGEGPIIDVRTGPRPQDVAEALVRFEHGPESGVWYSVRNLKQIRDIFGNPIDPLTSPRAEPEPEWRSSPRSVVTRLPDYSINAEVLKPFVTESKQLGSTEDLRFFVGRWLAIWQMGNAEQKAPTIRQIDDQIVSGEFNAREALRCIRRVRYTGKPCKHAVPHPVRSKKRRIRKKHDKRNLRVTRLCVGMEILMPWSLFMALRVRNHFGVPDSTALHQLFCDDPNHTSCF
jgi:hypothetical protein